MLGFKIKIKAVINGHVYGLIETSNSGDREEAAHSAVGAATSLLNGLRVAGSADFHSCDIYITLAPISKLGTTSHATLAVAKTNGIRSTFGVGALTTTNGRSWE